MYKARLVLAASLFCLVLAAGCGSKNEQAPASVSGTVTYQNKILKGGTVMFHTAGGKYSGNIRPDGTYSITDVPAGDHVVTVETESANPKQVVGGRYAEQYQGQAKEASKRPGAPSSVAPPAENYLKIDSKYADAKTSPLKATLSAGRQTKDFNLD
jgi:hypothetical protein